MPTKSMGQFMAALRKANGLTQQDVADRLNVSNKAVSRWERDETAPDISLLPAIAEMFGVSCDELIRGERNMDDQPRSEGAKTRTEKQIKSLISRASGKFETLSMIALLLAAAGFIAMLGISYGAFRPHIGFAVMLLFEAGAATLAAIAYRSAFRTVEDNELMENADPALSEGFRNSAAKRSFIVYFASAAAVLLSIPLAVHSNGFSVLDFNYYLPNALAVILILVIAYPFLKRLCLSRMTGKKAQSRSEADRVAFRMNIIQIGMVVLPILLVLISVSIQSGIAIGGVAVMSLAAASAAVFLVFLIKYPQYKKLIVLNGVRNLLLIPSLFLLAMAVGGVYELNANGESVGTGFYLLYDKLAPALVYLLAVIIVFRALIVKARKRGGN
ncbi:MAG: helix-turn-helix transcriptional regulator [Clostridia bacterium]|nr:helix-turn-helix transcriptional regulator [Clostridia bacterium]